MLTPTLLVLAAGASLAKFDAVPVIAKPVTDKDVLVPLSDSVKAATWDALREPPRGPVEFRLACIVFQPFGAPGRCVDAALLDPRKRQVDWRALTEAADRALTAGPSALLDIAQTRVSVLRLKPPADRKPHFEVRLFRVVVSPQDAMPAYAPGPALTSADFTFATPINGALLTANYPTRALRSDVTARVKLTCLVQPTRKLLCRDPGEIVTAGFSDAGIVNEFRLASYQIASTFELAPQDKRGEDIRGKSLTFTLNWQIPRN
ncbi:hypothetical protein [Novosphingobium sp. NDB2Meth1]|uniref:hypothetical protein n=1 Tax=Novosphingobium sp. NDB2Meth1 TaxID=1892847 RepID=UPI000AB5F826|nr:hypothetical protein [Novosphingobium sp. NDB2Meth1]